jgi:hypothetical protein
MRSVFFGGAADNYQVKVLASTYARLVESAIREFQLGCECTREYWSTHDAIAVGAMQQATSHFETCISEMHRATNFFKRLRRHPKLGGLSGINVRRPSFISAAVHDQLRDARNEIHHMEECIMKGKIMEGQPVAVMANGPETPHATEPNQTDKTIDRLVIGRRQLLLSDMANWLTEMHEFCGLMLSAQATASRGQPPS